MTDLFNDASIPTTILIDDEYAWYDEMFPTYEVKPRAYDAWNCVAYGCL